MFFDKEKELISLTEEFLEGRDAAFDKLIKLISQNLVNISYRYLGNYEDAKDVSQEIIIKLYRKLRTFHHTSKISTWIYRIAVNASLDFMRKRKKVFFLKEAITKDSKSNEPLRDEVEKKDIQECIRNGLDKLPLRQKNAIILKHFEGLKISQISKILGCSQSSVKTHLIRAVNNLRRELGGKK